MGLIIHDFPSKSIYYRKDSMKRSRTNKFVPAKCNLFSQHAVSLRINKITNEPVYFMPKILF